MSLTEVCSPVEEPDFERRKSKRSDKIGCSRGELG